MQRGRIRNPSTAWGFFFFFISQREAGFRPPKPPHPEGQRGGGGGGAPGSAVFTSPGGSKMGSAELVSVKVRGSDVEGKEHKQTRTHLTTTYIQGF